MNQTILSFKKACLFLCLIVSGLAVTAQTAASADDEALKQANNPLASIKTFNVHNYYMPSLYGVPDGSINQAWLRYAQPVGRFIVRASLPIVTTSFPEVDPVLGSTSINTTSGLGDMNAFVIYKFGNNSKVDIGIGPAVTLPTGTNDLGTGKWQIGLSAIAFFKSNPIVQFGTLLTWQMSYAGDSDRADVNMLNPQLFLMWQLGAGTYLRSTGVWAFDLENGTYNVPLGLGIGKVIKSGSKIFNIFMEPQYSVFSYGDGQPKLQLFVGFNTQF